MPHVKEDKMLRCGTFGPRVMVLPGYEGRMGTCEVPAWHYSFFFVSLALFFIYINFSVTRKL